MNERVQAFLRYLMNNLTASQWKNLHTHLGVKKYRIGWLLNEDEYRLDKFRLEEIICLANLLDVPPGRLIAEFGLGQAELTLETAKEYGITVAYAPARAQVA